MITQDQSVYRGSFGSLPGTWELFAPFPITERVTGLSDLGPGISTVLAITESGRAFRGNFSYYPGEWTEVHQVPLGTVQSEEKTWSGVKEGFRE